MDVVAYLKSPPPGLHLVGFPQRDRHDDPWKDLLIARARGEIWPLFVGKESGLEIVDRAPSGPGSKVSVPKKDTRVILIFGGAPRAVAPVLAILGSPAGDLLALGPLEGLATIQVREPGPSWFPGVRLPWWGPAGEEPGPPFPTVAKPGDPGAFLAAFGGGIGARPEGPCSTCGKPAIALCSAGIEPDLCGARICAGCALRLGPDRALCPPCAAAATTPASDRVLTRAPEEPATQKLRQKAKGAGERPSKPEPARASATASATTTATATPPALAPSPPTRQRGLFD